MARLSLDARAKSRGSPLDAHEGFILGLVDAVTRDIWLAQIAERGLSVGIAPPKETLALPSLHLLLAFVVTTAIFAFIPGPAMLYAAARTMSGGRRAGLLASLGIHVGGYGHVIAAAAGLSMLLQAVPVLYGTVRLAGAVYLVWLGMSLFRTGTAGSLEPAVFAPRGGRRAFVENVSVELLNPKTALFFLAFLPQFIDPSAGAPVWVQFVLLGTIVNLMFSSADLVCVLLAGAVLARMRQSSRAQPLLQRAGGTVLVGLGAHLALWKS